VGGGRRRVYLDAPALVKLIVAEAESATLSRWLLGAQAVGSAALLAEVPRAAARGGDAPELSAATAAVLAAVQTVALDQRLLNAAAVLAPPTPRTLAALHLATALPVAAPA